MEEKSRDRSFSYASSTSSSVSQNFENSDKACFICSKGFGSLKLKRYICKFCHRSVCFNDSKNRHPHQDTKKRERICDLCFRDFIVEQVKDEMRFQMTTGERSIQEMKDRIDAVNVLYQKENEEYNELFNTFNRRKETQNLREGELKAVIARKMADVDEIKTNLANMKHQKQRLYEKKQLLAEDVSSASEDYDSNHNYYKLEKNRINELDKQITEKLAENDKLKKRISELNTRKSVETAKELEDSTQTQTRIADTDQKNCANCQKCEIF